MTSAEPLGYEKVTLPRAMDLRRVAEWTETPITDIQALNPELRRWTTPVRSASYEVKVPIGTGDRLRERLAAASPGELAPLNWYRVKKGESIATIARKLSVSRTDLAEANALTLKSRVRAGQELIIPRAPATLLNARVDRPAPANAVSADASTGKADKADAERPVSSSAPAAPRHLHPPPRPMPATTPASSIASSAATRSSRSPVPSKSPSKRSSPGTASAAATSPPAIA